MRVRHGPGRGAGASRWRIENSTRRVGSSRSAAGAGRRRRSARSAWRNTCASWSSTRDITANRWMARHASSDILKSRRHMIEQERQSAFDLVVVGSGSAAQTVASRCRAAGWTVAMVDKRPFGGTCALRGCDPKKVLVDAAAAVDAARALDGKGVSPNGVEIDWPALIRFKHTFIDPVPEDREASLARAGIE